MAQMIGYVDVMVAETVEEMEKTRRRRQTGWQMEWHNFDSTQQATKVPQIPEDSILIYDFMRYEGFCERVDAANESKFVYRPTMDRLWRELCHEKIQAHGAKAD